MRDDDIGVPLGDVDCPETGEVETVVASGPDRMRCTGCERDVDTWAELLRDHPMTQPAD